MLADAVPVSCGLAGTMDTLRRTATSQCHAGIDRNLAQNAMRDNAVHFVFHGHHAHAKAGASR